MLKRKRGGGKEGSWFDDCFNMSQDGESGKVGERKRSLTLYITAGYCNRWG